MKKPELFSIQAFFMSLNIVLILEKKLIFAFVFTMKQIIKFACGGL